MSDFDSYTNDGIVCPTLMPDDEIVVTTLVRTGLRSPSQWEGQTSDGRVLYIRYRWGCLEIGIGTSLDDAVANCGQLFERQFGGPYDGSIEIDQLRQATLGIIAWPESYEYHPAPIQELDFLQNWQFRTSEVSPGVYKVKAEHALGPSIEMTGTDQSKLLGEVRVAALRMELEIQQKASRQEP
jgi:hypothetical protein